MRPAVLEARRAWRPGGVGELALINPLRTPGRTALGALSLAIGVCTPTLRWPIAFNDVLVGTLLGDAVAVQARSTDYVAVIATVLLGAAAVADVLFLNVRERATEFATLTRPAGTTARSDASSPSRDSGSASQAREQARRVRGNGLAGRRAVRWGLSL